MTGYKDIEVLSSISKILSISGTKGLSFITNRQRWNEGTFCASELAGIEPTPPAPKGAGYVRLDHSATVGYDMPYLGRLGAPATLHW
jgi:hypothetical protein